MLFRSEWYGVCVDYCGVNVFHVCLDFGVFLIVNVCDVACVVCCLFLTSGCCVVGVWGVVILVLSVMRVVGGVPL